MQAPPGTSHTPQGASAGGSATPGGAGNRFSIRTSQPNVKVSWEVKAVRNDRFVQRAGAPVEIEKSAADKGKYLAPTLYDQPADKGIFHHPKGAAGSK